MNSRSPYIRDTETNASTLESFGGQRVSNETYSKARELRRWIAENPGKRSAEMPPDLRSHLEFLLRRKLVSWKKEQAGRAYYVRQMQ